MINTLYEFSGCFLDPLELSESRKWGSTTSRICTTVFSFVFGFSTFGVFHGIYAINSYYTRNHTAVNPGLPFKPSYVDIRSANSSALREKEGAEITIPNEGECPEELSFAEREAKAEALELYIKKMRSNSKMNATQTEDFKEKENEFNNLKEYHNITKLIKAPNESKKLNSQNIEIKLKKMEILCNLFKAKRPPVTLYKQFLTDQRKDVLFNFRLLVSKPGFQVGVDENGIYLNLRGWESESSHRSYEDSISYAINRFAIDKDKIYFYNLKGLFEFILSINAIARNCRIDEIENFWSEYGDRLSEI